MIKEENGVKTIDNVNPGSLKYPSLNEVNYIAFDEITEEYHNELYGYIELQGWIGEYKNGKSVMSYTRVNRNGSNTTQNLILTEYVRHQIHHPENELNSRLTTSQLKESIGMMREFLETKDNE